MCTVDLALQDIFPSLLASTTPHSRLSKFVPALPGVPRIARVKKNWNHLKSHRGLWSIFHLTMIRTRSPTVRGLVNNLLHWVSAPFPQQDFQHLPD